MMPVGHYFYKMKCWLLLQSLVLFLVVLPGKTQERSGYTRACYFNYRSTLRKFNTKFWPEDIDPSLCTHLIFAFVSITNNDLMPEKPNHDGPNGLYARINALKLKNPKLQTLISVGGGAVIPEFHVTVSSPANMATFTNNSIEFALKHNFNGIDIDWEYPAFFGSPAGDKIQFTKLIKMMKAVCVKHGLLLTAALPAAKLTAQHGFELKKLSNNLDFINVMSYGYYGRRSTQVNHHSALFPNTDRNIKYYLSQGVPSHKIILGVALFGKGFTLADSKRHNIGDPVVGISHYGEGSAAYSIICQQVKSGEWTRKWLKFMKEPYAFKGDQWIGYDDMQSISIKAHYIQKMKLGGAMVWEISLDDFRGKCQNVPFPLMRILKSQLPD